MSDVTTWQTWPVLRIPGQRPRPANELPTDVSRAAAKRTTGAGAVDDQVAHVAHFTAAVYTFVAWPSPDCEIDGRATASRLCRRLRLLPHGNTDHE